MENYIRMSSKGQVVLPAAVRKTLHVHTGQSLAVAVQDGVILLKPIPRLAELEGVLAGTTLDVRKAVTRLRKEWDLGR